MPHVDSEKYDDYFCFTCYETMHNRGKPDTAMLVDATNTTEDVHATTEIPIDTYAEEELDGEVEDDAIPIGIYDAFAHACSDAIIELKWRNLSLIHI
eukprot:3261040-Pyramimonas_sp.AAC.1